MSSIMLPCFVQPRVRPPNPSAGSGGAACDAPVAARLHTPGQAQVSEKGAQKLLQPAPTAGPCAPERSELSSGSSSGAASSSHRVASEAASRGSAGGRAGQSGRDMTVPAQLPCPTPSQPAPTTRMHEDDPQASSNDDPAGQGDALQQSGAYAGAARTSDGSSVEFATGADLPAALNGPRATLLRSARRGDALSIQEVLRLHPGSATQLLAATDALGWTALHYAASKGHADAVAALLSAGASVSAADMAGRTPRELAHFKSHRVVEDMLVAR